MAGAQRVDGEEGGAVLVLPDEAAGKLAGEDAREDGGHARLVPGARGANPSCAGPRPATQKRARFACRLPLTQRVRIMRRLILAAAVLAALVLALLLLAAGLALPAWLALGALPLGAWWWGGVGAPVAFWVLAGGWALARAAAGSAAAAPPRLLAPLAMRALSRALADDERDRARRARGRHRLVGRPALRRRAALERSLLAFQAEKS